MATAAGAVPMKTPMTMLYATQADVIGVSGKLARRQLSAIRLGKHVTISERNKLSQDVRSKPSRPMASFPVLGSETAVLWQNRSHSFGLGLGLTILVLVLVLIFWSCFHHYSFPSALLNVPGPVENTSESWHSGINGRTSLHRRIFTKERSYR